MRPTNRSSEAARVGRTLRLKNFGGGFGTGATWSRSSPGTAAEDAQEDVCAALGRARSDRTAANGRARRENYTPSKK